MFDLIAQATQPSLPDVPASWVSLITAITALVAAVAALVKAWPAIRIATDAKVQAGVAEAKADVADQSIGRTNTRLTELAFKVDPRSTDTK